jgi:hypothetical protein
MVRKRMELSGDTFVVIFFLRKRKQIRKPLKQIQKQILSEADAD